MKHFLFTTALTLLSLVNVLNAQDSTKLTKNDSIPNKIDTVKLDLSQAIPSAIKLYKTLKGLKGLYDQIKLDHTSLLEIKGKYLNVGYIQQGYNTFEIGVSKGKRELFSITKFQEIHFNTQLLNHLSHRYLGLNIGISKSGAFFNKALEANWVTNFNGKHSFIFRPEFGFSIFGSLNINYGYNLLFNNDLEGLNTHILHIRYSKQNFESKIKKKIVQIKITLERDRERLRSLGINIPNIQFK